CTCTVDFDATWCRSPVRSLHVSLTRFFFQGEAGIRDVSDWSSAVCSSDLDRPPIERLIAIMARLRDPARGCPWDVEQSFATIAPYTIEEAYEVADAIQQGDMGALKGELGDLLLQVVFHARMAEEAGSFGIEDVARAINDKMIKRHPHVFADAVVAGAEAQTQAWEAQKAAERKAKGEAEGHPVGALDGVTIGLPALTRALKLQRRAARVGF